MFIMYNGYSRQNMSDSLCNKYVAKGRSQQCRSMNIQIDKVLFVHLQVVKAYYCNYL